MAAPESVRLAAAAPEFVQGATATQLDDWLAYFDPDALVLTGDADRSMTRRRAMDTLQRHVASDLVWVETPPSLCGEILESITGEHREELTDADVRDVFGGGLHGAEHGMIKLTPLALRLDKGDLGGLSTPAHAETGVPTWFVHDAVDGGLGFSRRIYDRFEFIARRTRERVAACDCTGTGGCPACIMDAQCGNQNRHLHTGATVAVLDRVLDRL